MRLGIIDLAKASVKTFSSNWRAFVVCYFVYMLVLVVHNYWIANILKTYTQQDNTKFYIFNIFLSLVVGFFLLGSSISWQRYLLGKEQTGKFLHPDIGRIFSVFWVNIKVSFFSVWPFFVAAIVLGYFSVQAKLSASAEYLIIGIVFAVIGAIVSGYLFARTAPAMVLASLDETVKVRQVFRNNRGTSIALLLNLLFVYGITAGVNFLYLRTLGYNWMMPPNELSMMLENAGLGFHILSVVSLIVGVFWMGYLSTSLVEVTKFYRQRQKEIA